MLSSRGPLTEPEEVGRPPKPQALRHEDREWLCVPAIGVRAELVANPLSWARRAFGGGRRDRQPIARLLAGVRRRPAHSCGEVAEEVLRTFRAEWAMSKPAWLERDGVRFSGNGNSGIRPRIPGEPSQLYLG